MINTRVFAFVVGLAVLAAGHTPKAAGQESENIPTM